MKFKAIIGAAIAALAFSSCGVTEGTVYDKSYSPEKRWTTQEADYDNVCTTKTRTSYVNGKSKTSTYQDCKRVFDGYETKHHRKAACYRLKFKNRDGDKGSACVSKATYTKHDIGDYYAGKNK